MLGLQGLRAGTVPEVSKVPYKPFRPSLKSAKYYRSFYKAGKPEVSANKHCLPYEFNDLI